MRDKPLPIEATLAINDGKVIDAIKLVRSAEGLDLVQAKARVDRYIEDNPALKDKIDEMRRELRNKLIRNVLLFDAVLVAVLIWWFFLR
jgi:ribosomal protein L7/L12